MNRKPAPKLPVMIALAALLLFAAARESRAQCATLDDCRRLVTLLNDQVTTLNRALAEKTAQADARADAIGQLQKQVADAQKDAAVQAAIADNKQKQLDTQEEIKKALRDQVEDYKKIVTLNQESIKDRDAVIQALVKVSKRTALEKAVEAIPSVASIIALALVKR